MEKGCRQL